MSNQTSDCCEHCGAQTTTVKTGKQSPPGTSDAETDARWIAGSPVLEGDLPEDLRAAAGEFYDAGAVETLGDFAEATRAAAGGAIDVDQLCHADGETPHRATTGDGTYHFQCFYDGVALALLRAEPVDVRTVSPSGVTVELHVDADGTVEPATDGAAMSFGIAPDAVATDGDPTPEDVYGAACPWVRAFPSRERYEAWAAGTDAATVGLPLAAGAPVAAALVAER